jgi:regulator of protease activity HflC (stomatin/prohibitin superfamily)
MGFFVNKHDELRVGNVILTGVVGLTALVSVISACTKVDTGCTGIRTYFGSVQEDTYDAGFHLKVPFVEKVVDINNKVQKVEVDADSTSKDLQAVSSTLAVNYHLAKEASVSMYKNIGLTYEDTILQPAIQEATKSVMARYKAEELIQKRSEVSNEVMGEIAEKVSDYGIIVDEFNITNFSFSTAFNDAIEQKLVAEQNKIKAQTENEQRVASAEADASEAKARAEGEAESARIKAQGEADAIKARADAEAEANKKINESITNELIDYNRIQSWNGQLPNVMTGDSDNIIVDATK